MNVQSGTDAEGEQASTLADRSLLEKIDKLFACNVGEYISLPQLVVLGDQSSGKSSVLEALTGLSFPRDSGLCTRFATQIIFRRVRGLDQRNITASIISASDVEPDQVQKLQAWSASGLQTLTLEGFSKMMKEVHGVMGLSRVISDRKPTFSKNVLRLEICGPNEDHLSVIDLPGMFKNTTSGRTTKKDIALVRNMVEQYMTNPRSIMLAVVPANVDIATQEIIEMAREVDPRGVRTLRILTKPDLVDKGAEIKIIEMIEGGNASGQLGWILVRNLGQKQLDDGGVDRDQEEELFHQTAPWNRISKDNYGIKTLKIRLKEILTSNVRLAFPEVRAELIKKLREAKDALRLLGYERQTAEQQRTVLLEIVSTFKTLTQNSLATNYGSSDLFEDHDLRLATLIQNRSIQFSDEMTAYGHEYSFQKDDENDNTGKPPPVTDATDGEASKKKATGHACRKVPDIPTLQEIVQIQIAESVQDPCSGIHDWIEKEYKESRGFEIGVFNHTLLSTLMKKQTKKWPMLGLGYMNDVVTLVHTFIEKLLDTICVDENMVEGILTLLMDDLFSRYRDAMQQMALLLEIERQGTPMTLNHYLNDNLEKCRQKRIHAAMKKRTYSVAQHGEVVRLSDLMEQHPMSNTTHTTHDIHDILNSYYKVALKRFVDAAWMQAADYHLVTGPRAPMNLFSSFWVNSLTDEQLEQVAGEDLKTKRKRRQLSKQIDELEAGKKVLLS